MTESEEDKHAKSKCKLNPAIVIHLTTGRYQHDVLPLRTMNQVPAVWNQRWLDRVAEENVELERNEDDYECH